MSQVLDPVTDVAEQIVLMANRVAMQAFVEAYLFAQTTMLDANVAMVLRNGVYYRVFEAYVEYWTQEEKKRRPPIVA